MRRCKKCKNGVLEYHEDYISCEIEVWHCYACDTLFNVPIEIVRDFKEAEEVQE